MHTRIATFSLLTGLLFCSAALARAEASSRLADLARAVVQGAPGEANEAAADLREAGPVGMEALLARIDSCQGDSCAGAKEILDRVCGVRDCADIRLFWYTDLAAAEAAAAAAGKPILSLRLMGRLDEEFSCANSRFFRTVFYKNHDINQLLRDRYILHWRSVRPVPKVTIDFGDGTRLERTLTGNSIHYVLDGRGRLVDAFPGLYGPETFQRALRESAEAAREAANLNDKQLVTWVTARHTRQLNVREAAFRGDLQSLRDAASAEAARQAEEKRRAAVAKAEEERRAAVAKAEEKSRAEVVANADSELEKIPTARDPWAILQKTPGVLTDRSNVGGLETGSKQAGEQSILQALAGVTDEQLRDLAQLRRPHVHLDAASRAFLLRKHGVTDPQEGDRLVDAFESTVALDEVIDEYRTGPAILQALSDRKIREDLDLEAFNQWVYEKVFRTPLSDPWLGLAPDDVYTGLPAATRTVAPQLAG